MAGFDAMMERVADVPAADDAAPAAGARLAHPGDVFDLLREARPRRRPRAGATLHELFRVMTMSVGDLLDDYFENDALKGAYASTGVVGVWAGPRTPGTAYNLLHHELGELDGVGGAWGHVRGGMGAISEAIAASARAHGADIRTERAGRLDRRGRRPRDRRDAGERRGADAPARPLRRAPEDDRARPRRRRALPGRGRRGHAALPLAAAGR